MSGKTKIDWCDATWNVVTGCSKVSEGCRNCYAESIAKRFWGERKFTDVQFHEDRLDLPMRWKKPQTIFVTSMGDLFHPDVPDAFIFKVLMATHLANDRPSWLRHTYILLTKRPERMSKIMGKPIHNLWLGVSVEDQKTADERIPLLLQTPAAKRIVSVEPMLGAVDLTYIQTDAYTIYNTLEGCGDTERPGYKGQSIPNVFGNKIDLVIAGCESGHHRRPCNPDWLRSLRDQCVAAGVPFFLKQMEVDGKVVKMPALDGKVWDERP